MNSDLSELFERLTYCREEIESYNMQVALFLKNAVRVRCQPRRKSKERDFYISLLKPVPISLRSKAGMIANELRSCLDALACQLAIRNGQAPRGVYFPISKNKTVFDDDGMRKIKKLSSADQQKIVEMRPYAECSPVLFQLHEADRTRKHQKLSAFAGSNAVRFAGLVEYQGVKDAVIRGATLDGVYVNNLKYNGNEPLSILGKEYLILEGCPIDLFIEIKIMLAYQEPETIAGLDATESLRGFADQVESILTAFK